MTPRIHVAQALRAGDIVELPAAQSRHVQVLRLQPGSELVLFDGRGGEWQARVVRMGRTSVDVALGAHDPVDREPSRRIVMALGMPANERMDALVEKATELGVAAIQPLVCERSVLRLAGERATKRQQHWQAIAVAASEQSGRTTVPRVQPIAAFASWLSALAPPTSADEMRLVLSPQAERSWSDAGPAAHHASLVCLSGPEGGFAPSEVEAAQRAGFVAVSMGPRILRADTAPLAVLAWCALHSHGPAA